MESLQDQLCRFVLTTRITDDFSVVQIEQDTQVVPLLPNSDVSQVTNDCAMWIGCFEFTVQRIPQIRFIALRLMDPIVGYRVTGL